MAYQHFNSFLPTGILHYLTPAQSLIYMYMMVRADQHTGRLFVTSKILAKELGIEKDTARQAFSMLSRMDLIRTEITHDERTRLPVLIVRLPDAEHIESVIDFLDPHYARARRSGRLNIMRLQKQLFSEGAKSPTAQVVLSGEQTELFDEPLGFLEEVAESLGKFSRKSDPNGS